MTTESIFGWFATTDFFLAGRNYPMSASRLAPNIASRTIDVAVRIGFDAIPRLFDLAPLYAASSRRSVNAGLEKVL